MSCNICVEDYNNRKVKKVICDFCDYDSCHNCCERYLLNLNENAHCMNCKKEWTRSFIIKKLGNKFVNNDYKTHRENILLDKERSLFPATLPHVERLNKIEKNDIEINDLKKQAKELNERIRLLQQENELGVNNSEIKKIKLIKKCPYNNCHGFLNSEWFCSLCENTTCNKCNEIETDDHKCNEDVVESIKLLAKDTKTCPTCGTGIFRISGCNQIFCTECHTSFCWVTGQIETKILHNPHYFDFIKQGGKIQERNINEVRCGREIDHMFITMLVHVQKKAQPLIDYIKKNGIMKERKNDEQGDDNTLYRDMTNRRHTPSYKYDYIEIAREIIHIRHVEIPRFNVDAIQNNLDVRVSLMKNKITEDQFKMQIQRREKDIQKKNEIAKLLAMYCQCMTEIFYRIMNDFKELKFNEDDYIEELLTLKEYTNNCFKEIHKIYNCKKYIIDKKYCFI